jgi:hypothetical protein
MRCAARPHPHPCSTQAASDGGRSREETRFPSAALGCVRPAERPGSPATTHSEGNVPFQRKRTFPEENVPFQRKRRKPRRDARQLRRARGPGPGARRVRSRSLAPPPHPPAPRSLIVAIEQGASGAGPARIPCTGRTPRAGLPGPAGLRTGSSRFKLVTAVPPAGDRGRRAPHPSPHSLRAEIWLGARPNRSLFFHGDPTGRCHSTGTTRSSGRGACRAGAAGHRPSRRLPRPRCGSHLHPGGSAAGRRAHPRDE